MNSMKVWAKALQDHRIKKDVVQEFAPARPSDLDGWTEVIASLSQTMEMERPVILSKHIHDLNQFGRTVFRQSDYMDFFPFDSFEIEVFPEQKHETAEILLLI